MNLYLVDHFVPFPQSDGGLWNVIAENDEECFDLIVEQDDDCHPQFYHKIRENIQKSYKYSVADDNPSEVITSFIT